MWHEPSPHIIRPNNKNIAEQILQSQIRCTRHAPITFVIQRSSITRTRNMQGMSLRVACMTSDAKTELTENSSSLIIANTNVKLGANLGPPVWAPNKLQRKPPTLDPRPGWPPPRAALTFLLEHHTGRAYNRIPPRTLSANPSSPRWASGSDKTKGFPLETALCEVIHDIYIP